MVRVDARKYDRTGVSQARDRGARRGSRRRARERMQPAIEQPFARDVGKRRIVRDALEARGELGCAARGGERGELGVLRGNQRGGGFAPRARGIHQARAEGGPGREAERQRKPEDAGFPPSHE